MYKTHIIYHQIFIINKNQNQAIANINTLGF
ncbi:hypothetical protein PEC302107_21240 [Pectobacterium araliae]|nr:hypothetical protein PEC302107_21240 [Pectobacterium carotovorum subsp. carotovorum]